MGRVEDEAVVRDYLHRAEKLVSAGDTESYLDIWAEDGVLEMPFAPVEAARLFAGKPAISAMVGAMAWGSNGSGDPDQSFETFAFVDVVIRGTEVPGEFVVEMGSHGQRRDGSQYNNRYCGIARVCDGRMLLWREFFDPTRLLA